MTKQTGRKMKSLQHGRQGLTSVIGQEPLLSLLYGRRHLKGVYI